jgi:hypothetical protein
VALENFEKKTYKKHMSHSSKGSGRRDGLLNLFFSRVPVTCDMKTRSYQYSITSPRLQGFILIRAAPASFPNALTGCSTKFDRIFDLINIAIYQGGPGMLKIAQGQ